MALGGLLSCLRLAERASGMGVGSYVTSSMDGVVARCGAAHLSAALPDCGYASGLAVGKLFSHDPEDPCAPVRGRISLPVTPGLGLRPGWRAG